MPFMIVVEEVVACFVHAVVALAVHERGCQTNIEPASLHAERSASFVQ